MKQWEIGKVGQGGLPEEEEVWDIGLLLKARRKPTSYSWIIYLKGPERLRKNA